MEVRISLLVRVVMSPDVDMDVIQVVSVWLTLALNCKTIRSLRLDRL